MRYYDVKRHWTKKIEPHLGDEELNKILVEDFHKFTYGCWGQTFQPGQFPRDFESCDWDVDHRGKEPKYWRYVKHAACHWLVNFNLKLAQLVEPNTPWRILTDQPHSTVWDGEETLFDLNFLALGIPADEAFEMANKTVLPIGEKLVVHYAYSCYFDRKGSPYKETRRVRDMVKTLLDAGCHDTEVVEPRWGDWLTDDWKISLSHHGTDFQVLWRHKQPWRVRAGEWELECKTPGQVFIAIAMYEYDVDPKTSEASIIR